MRNDRGISSGDEITTLEQLTNLQLSAIRAQGRGSGEVNYVARAEIDFPDELRLTGDIESDTRKLEGLTSPKALAASGGICNPVDVDYSLFVVSVADEPLGASLPTIAAPRGGLRFVTPPTFASVGAAGTAIWTEATDAAAVPAPAGGIVPNGSPVKPLQRIVCGQEVEVYVDAIPTRLQFGNMMARFSPEQVAANTELALANAARVRELYRLSKIASYSTSVSSSQLLGAARDILATMDQAAAAYRYRHRLNRSIPLRVVLPGWAIDLIRADLTREMAHDNDLATMALTDAQVETLLRSRGFAPTFMLDGTSANGSATQVAYGYQGWGAQTAGPLLDWPHTLVWYLFAEGTFQRLDAGTMDFGVVRDSILDATNDYETFIETFEGLAKRGFESLEIVSAVRPNGASAGTVETATSPVIY
jgi:hypothetical protein